MDNFCPSFFFIFMQPKMCANEFPGKKGTSTFYRYYVYCKCIMCSVYVKYVCTYLYAYFHTLKNLQYNKYISKILHEGCMFFCVSLKNYGIHDFSTFIWELILKKKFYEDSNSAQGALKVPFFI